MQPSFIDVTHLLLADMDGFGRMLQTLQQMNGAGRGYSWLIAAVCGIAGLWLGVRWFERRWSLRGLTSHDPWALFAMLCDAHGLSRHERKMLRTAAAHDATACCRLFIDPTMLHQFAIATSETAAEYGKLNRKLFGDG